jgi:carbamoyltransferase
MHQTLILGIHSGHNAGAALVSGGRVLAAISEERMRGCKNVCGYPERAIERCLEIAGVAAQDINHVALASHHTFCNEVDDYIAWKQGKGPSPFPRPAGKRTIAQLGPLARPVWALARRAHNLRLEAEAKVPNSVGPWEYTDYHPPSLRIDRVQRHLGLDAQSIHFVAHHRCHATYAGLAAPWRDRPVLTLVADQVGDFVNASVWRSVPGGPPEIVSRSYTLNSLGRIYSTVTGLLGMRPFEDEHKVMGLAPYAAFDRTAPYLPAFARLIGLRGSTFIEPRSAAPCWKTLPNLLNGVRFDIAAGAVQLFLEQWLCRWVKAAVGETGISSVAMSGGVALNVKANRVIGTLTGVRELFVPPASGDESLAIGAAQALALEIGNLPDTFEPLGSPFLGDEFDRAEVLSACRDRQPSSDVRLLELDDHAGYVAAHLDRGSTVARFVGRMEFGPRALGNRSILADASDLSIVRRINQTIKRRDFWMPFAPAVLAERADDYFENPKGHSDSAMTVAFQSTPHGREDIPAALHPADGTLRPQVVTTDNPGLHAVLERFEAMNGRGAVLNTSFNLHRNPIVRTPQEAVRTFFECDLDVLAFEHFALERKQRRHD